MQPQCIHMPYIYAYILTSKPTTNIDKLKFGELAKCNAIAKFKSHQYFFFSRSIVTLVAFQ